MPTVTVESVSIPVADMARSIEFYTTVLSCEKVSDSEVTGEALDQLYGLPNVRLRWVEIRLGNETIRLIEFLNPKGRPVPTGSHSNDHWFQHLAIVVSDMEKACQRLQSHGVYQTSCSPQVLPEWNPVAGGIQALYFKDVDGHDLELIHFPEGKGAPKWQQSSESLFLGIDHTAIVVANTEASRAFYCDCLGMELQQTSRNFGLEQERLSDVPEAQVRVSSLKASEGLGVELLEYETPQGGRAVPDDTCANDLWCWQTRLIVQDADATAQSVQASRYLISPIVASSNPTLGFEQSFLVQDLDGHRLQIIQL